MPNQFVKGVKKIVADKDSYTTKVWHGRAWVHLQSLERGQRIAIPLKGPHLSTGALRILLQPNGQVEIHHAADEDPVCSTRPCGAVTVGVHKGYTEVYTDSDGERHGQGLGNLLAAESDQRKVKGRRRNHLKAPSTTSTRRRATPARARNIEQHNLGRKTQRRRRHQRRVRNLLCQAVHAVVDKAGTSVCEDLSASMKPAKYRHKDTNRRLHGWVKGVMADTLNFGISAQRFCAGIGQSGLHIANRIPHGPVAGHASLGSVLLSRRGCAGRGCQCRRNIPARLYDEEITLYMPYRDVRALLAERTRPLMGTARSGLELRGCATPSPSTESEVPRTHMV